MAGMDSIRSSAYWTEARIREAASGFSTITEFAKGNNRAYKRALAARLIDDIFKVRKQRNPLTEGQIREVAANCSSKSQLFDFDASAYNAARRLGILDTLFETTRRSWDEESAIAESAKYTSKSEFQRAAYQAYAILLASGKLESLFDNKLNTWCYESVKSEAAKYKTRSDFARGSGSAYIWALRNNVVSEFIPEVSDGHNTRDCVYIWAIDNTSGVYKVGVTSSNLGTFRIEKVASKCGVSSSATVIALKKVGAENAMIIEAKLKKIGHKYNFHMKFDGCTEFRVMSPSQLSVAIAILDSY